MNAMHPDRQRMLDQAMRQSQPVERRAAPPPPPPRGEPYVPDRPTSPAHRFRGGGDDDEDGGGDSVFGGRSRVPLPDQSAAMHSAVGSERRMHDLQRTTAKRGRKEDFANEPPPALYSIHKGTVKNIQSFGAFVAMDGFQKHGLVHISQLADFRVDDVKSAVNQGQSVWVKVVSIDNEAGKIALSMKYVDQTNGKDLDDLNERVAEESKRGPGESRARPPILKIEAIVNTTCSRCGKPGHMMTECWNSRADAAYDLVASDDEEYRRAAKTASERVAADEQKKFKEQLKAAAKAARHEKREHRRSTHRRHRRHSKKESKRKRSRSSSSSSSSSSSTRKDDRKRRDTRGDVDQWQERSTTTSATRRDDDSKRDDRRDDSKRDDTKRDDDKRRSSPSRRERDSPRHEPDSRRDSSRRDDDRRRSPSPARRSHRSRSRSPVARKQRARSPSPDRRR